MPPIVIFDLGNVLIHYCPGPALAEIQRRTGLGAWRIRWHLHRAGIRGLGDGSVAADHFLGEINRRLRLSMTVRELSDIWGLDLPGPVAGMLEWLEEIRGQTRVAILSDTNIFHWQSLARRYPALATVPEIILSYKVGLRKPDERLYQHAARRLGIPENVGPSDAPLYFDDRVENIRAAKTRGWDAHLFRDAATARAVWENRRAAGINTASARG
jgi:FMN phosphatase YigB (HAD superfamily)